MPTDTELNTLIINEMTKTEYEALEEKDSNQIYIVDGVNILPTTTETWTFTLEDGTEVTKKIVVSD